MTNYRRVVHVLVAVAACLVLLAHDPLAAGQEPQHGLDIVVDPVVQQFLLDHDIPGAAVGILWDGQLATHRAGLPRNPPNRHDGAPV